MIQKIKEFIQYLKCIKRGYHDFEWHWLQTDSVYECHFPQCKCGEYKVLRFNDQSLDSKIWCNDIGFPTLEHSNRITFNDNWIIKVYIKVKTIVSRYCKILV